MSNTSATRSKLALAIVACIMVASSACNSATTRQNNHATWTLVKHNTLNSPGGGVDIYGVSCARPTACVVVGQIHTKSHGNQRKLSKAVMFTNYDRSSRWSNLNIPGNIGTLYAISCTNTFSCMAVGETPTLYTGNPAGAQPYIQPAKRPRGVVISGSLVSGNWIVNRLPNDVGALRGVSCLSQHCIVVGSNIYGNGIVLVSGKKKSWTLLPVEANHNSFNGVSCVSSIRCIAVGNDIGYIGRAGSGSHWSLIHGLSSIPWSGISCTTSHGYCVAVGGSSGEIAVGGTFAVTLNAGKNWSIIKAPLDAQPVPSFPAGRIPPTSVNLGETSLDAVSCSGRICLAGGSRPYASFASLYGSIDGTTWNDVDVSNGSYAIRGISCPTAGSCWVVGTNYTFGLDSSFADEYTLLS